jgi:hypothetical protein
MNDDRITEDRVALMIEQAVSTALRSHEQHLMAHMDRQFAVLVKTFSDAFPGGDPHGHRLAHEKAIANATWWDRVKSDAVGKVAAGATWAFVLFVAIAAWEHIKTELRK